MPVILFICLQHLCGCATAPSPNGAPEGNLLIIGERVPFEVQKIPFFNKKYYYKNTGDDKELLALLDNPELKYIMISKVRGLSGEIVRSVKNRVSAGAALVLVYPADSYFDGFLPYTVIGYERWGPAVNRTLSGDAVTGKLRTEKSYRLDDPAQRTFFRRKGLQLNEAETVYEFGNDLTPAVSFVKSGSGHVISYAMEFPELVFREDNDMILETVINTIAKR